MILFLSVFLPLSISGVPQNICVLSSGKECCLSYLYTVFHLEFFNDIFPHRKCFICSYYRMGNAGSNARERHKPGDMHAPSSPGKEAGQAFTFEKKPNSKLVYLSSTEEEEQPYYTKPNSSSLVWIKLIQY